MTAACVAALAAGSESPGARPRAGLVTVTPAPCQPEPRRHWHDSPHESLSHGGAFSTMPVVHWQMRPGPGRLGGLVAAGIMMTVAVTVYSKAEPQ